MNRFVALFCLVLLLSACSGSVAEFWRPVSEPNTLLPPQKAQQKLNFDLSQCNCGIYPSNIAQPDLVAFQPDQQRYTETSITRTINGKHKDDCMQRPSLVVSECMRARGWETTTCSGRMPLASGGSLCAGAIVD